MNSEAVISFLSDSDWGFLVLLLLLLGVALQLSFPESSLLRVRQGRRPGQYVLRGPGTPSSRAGEEELFGQSRICSRRW